MAKGLYLMERKDKRSPVLRLNCYISRRCCSLRYWRSWCD